MAAKRTAPSLVDRLMEQKPETIDRIMSFAKPGVRPPDFAEVSKRMQKMKNADAESIVWNVVKNIIHPPKEQSKGFKELIANELSDSDKVMIEIAPDPVEQRRRIIAVMKQGLNDPEKKLPSLFMSGLHAGPVMEGVKNPEEVIQHFISGTPLSAKTPSGFEGPLTDAEKLEAGSEAASRQMSELGEAGPEAKQLSKRMGAAKQLTKAIPQSGAFAGREQVSQGSIMSSLFGSGQMAEPEEAAIEASQLYTKKTAAKGKVKETGQLSKKKPASLFKQAASGKAGASLLKEVRESGALSAERYAELLKEAEQGVRGIPKPKTLNMGSAVEGFSDIESKAGSFFKKAGKVGKKGGKMLPLILLALLTGAMAGEGEGENG